MSIKNGLTNRNRTPLKSSEAMFVDLQSFDFRIERLPGNSKPGSSAE